MGQIALEIRSPQVSSSIGQVEQDDRLFSGRIPGVNCLGSGFQFYPASALLTYELLTSNTIGELTKFSGDFLS